MYAYSINSPEHRNETRSAVMAYFFDFHEAETDAEMTFEGFTKSALDPSMLAELDAFSGGLG